MHYACKMQYHLAMPSLQVRDLPDHIYRALREQAKAERRSLAQQTIVILERGLNLEPIRAIRDGDLPDAPKLAREDRER
jgi:plasmid stability protein